MNWIKCFHKARVVDIYQTIMVGLNYGKTIWMYNEIKDKYIGWNLFGKKVHGQDEFWLHHNTIDYVVTLRALMEESCLRAKHLYCCVVYFNIDMVPHVHLRRLMEELVVPSEYKLAISWIYDKFICCAWN